jgi:hypothetical protein
MKMIEDMHGDGVVGDENVRRELISIYTAHGFNLETRITSGFVTNTKAVAFHYN